MQAADAEAPVLEFFELGMQGVGWAPSPTQKLQNKKLDIEKYDDT